jgi:hypothetical protein
MSHIRDDDESDLGATSSGLDTDRVKDRALLDRLCAKLLRLDREAVNLAATMRQKLKSS